MVGDCDTGKTTTFELLVRVMNDLADASTPGFAHVESVLLNPTAMTMADLFGEFSSEENGEWKDGALPDLLASIAARTPPLYAIEIDACAVLMQFSIPTSELRKLPAAETVAFLSADAGQELSPVLHAESSSFDDSSLSPHRGAAAAAVTPPSIVLTSPRSAALSPPVSPAAAPQSEDLSSMLRGGRLRTASIALQMDSGSRRRGSRQYYTAPHSPLVAGDGTAAALLDRLSSEGGCLSRFGLESSAPRSWIVLDSAAWNVWTSTLDTALDGDAAQLSICLFNGERVHVPHTGNAIAYVSSATHFHSSSFCFRS